MGAFKRPPERLSNFPYSEHEAYPAFRAFRHLAQRAFCDATMRFRAAGDIVRLRVVIETTFRPFAFAHLAR